MKDKIENIVYLEFRLPWWWKFYVVALLLFARAGVLSVCPEKAARFIVYHAKIEQISWPRSKPRSKLMA